MVNWPALRYLAGSAFHRQRLSPDIIVPDISHLRFQALKSSGITGIVIDKDNCLTKPHHDDLVPNLQDAWNRILSTFGPENVLVVSNSVGLASKDIQYRGAEAVSRKLGTPVLIHAKPKPAKRTASSILDYFSSQSASDALRKDVLWTPAASTDLVFHDNPSSPFAHRSLLVVGDRISTDVALASQIKALAMPTVSVLTTTLWQRESLFTRVLRFLESRIPHKPQQLWSHAVVTYVPQASKLDALKKQISFIFYGTYVMLRTGKIIDPPKK